MARTSLTEKQLRNSTHDKAKLEALQAKLADHDTALDSVESGGTTATSQVHHVRAASTGNVANLAACSTTMDTSVTLVAGDRVLLKDQTNAAQNGIYVMGTVGGGTGPLTRATDWDAAVELKQGTLVHVAEGTANANLFYEITADFPMTVGTSHQHFTGIWVTSATLTADGPGRALMATGYLDEATATDKFAAQAITGALLKNATVTATQLASDAVTEPKVTAGILTCKHAAVGAAGATVGIIPNLFVIPVADGSTVLDALTLDATYGKIQIDDAWFQKNTVTGGTTDAVQVCIDAGGTDPVTNSFALNTVATGGIVRATQVIAAKAAFAAGAHIYVKRTHTTDCGGTLFLTAYRVA